jgi:hypothetical protein
MQAVRRVFGARATIEPTGHFAVNRIFEWLARLSDPLDGVRTIARVRTFVVGAVLRIGADNEKIPAGLNQPVTRAGGQDDHVACLERQHASFDTAALNLGRSVRDAECFVDMRVIMDEVVDRVAPRAPPAIGLKERILTIAGSNVVPKLTAPR